MDLRNCLDRSPPGLSHNKTAHWLIFCLAVGLKDSIVIPIKKVIDKIKGIKRAKPKEDTIQCNDFWLEQVEREISNEL